MKAVVLVGILLVALGVLSFLVPVPYREEHSVKIGDARFGVQTEHSEKLPPVVGVVLVAAGAVVLAFGSRRS
jgi:uncharacterized membrane protein